MCCKTAVLLAPEEPVLTAVYIPQHSTAAMIPDMQSHCVCAAEKRWIEACLRVVSCMRRSMCMGMAAVVPAFQLLGKECPCEARVAAAVQAEDNWAC